MNFLPAPQLGEQKNSFIKTIQIFIGVLNIQQSISFLLVVLSKIVEY